MSICSLLSSTPPAFPSLQCALFAKLSQEASLGLLDALHVSPISLAVTRCAAASICAPKGSAALLATADALAGKRRVYLQFHTAQSLP